MKSKVKERERSLIMVGKFPVIGKAKHSQEITFLQRVTQIVPRDVKLWPLYTERSKVWLFVCFLIYWWTLALQSGISSSARPAVTTAGLPVGHQGSNPSASSFLYPSEEEAGEENTWTPVLVTAAAPGCLPGTHFPRLLSELDPRWHEGHTSDHTSMGVVGQDTAINSFNKCGICGLKGLNEQLKDSLSLH